MVTIYFAACFAWLLFESGAYFFGKPWDVNVGWIGYEQVRRWRLLDAVSSAYSRSLLLSAVGMTRTPQTESCGDCRQKSFAHVCAAVLTTAATIWGGCLFHSKALDCTATIQGGRPLIEGGIYSKKYSICWHYTLWQEFDIASLQLSLYTLACS